MSASSTPSAAYSTLNYRQLALFNHAETPDSSRMPDGSRTPAPRAAPTAAGVPCAAALTSHSQLSAAVTAYPAHLAERADVAERTRWAMLRDLEVTGRLLGLSRALGSLTQSDLEHVKLELKKTSKPSTVERRLSTLSQFVRWLVLKGCLNSRLHVAVPQAAEELPTVLTPDQVKAMLTYTAERSTRSAAGARQAFLVRLLLATAMKKQDALALRMDDLALDTDPPQIRVGRGNKARRITAPADLNLHHFWQAYAHTGAPVEAVGYNAVFAYSYKVLEKDLADVSGALKWSHVLGFSTLRWTAALRDLQGGLEPERLRIKMGLSEMQWKETLGLLRRLAV